MKLSKHGKQRMSERTDLQKKQYKELFRNALRKGRRINELKDGEIKDWLKKNIPYKNKGIVKIYQNYVFIYSKNNHRLYTMYKLPNELINESEKDVNE